MSASARLLAALALAGLAPFPARAQTAAEPPEKIARFEQMLVRSPGPGRAFDEVFGHWFSTAGAAALEARWRAARDAAPAGSAQAAAYGLLLGQLAERIGDADTARARYADAAAAAPADFRAWHRLGRLEIREGKLPAGLAALEKAADLELSPADAQDVLRDLARARSRAMDEAGALKAWKNLADRFPDDALVLEEVGQAQLEASAYDEAAATFSALEKAAAGDAYRAVLARLRLGEVAARKGEKETALARFSAALDGTHRDSWLHREAQARVDALFREQGDFDGLVAFHEARLSGASRDPAAARRLAELLIELGRADAALAWFDKAAGWSPDDHALRFAHVKALVAADRGEAALPLLQTLVKLHPKETEYRVALGEFHWNRAKSGAGVSPVDAASPAAARALALETWAALAPEGAPVADLLALAEIYRARGLDEETRATLARALAAEPASYDLRERLALQLLAMQREDEAWAVARNHPAGLADAAQYRRLASLEKRNGLLDEALASTDRGLALATDNYELLDLRWQILAELQRWDDALALFPRLLAQAPGDFALAALEARHVQALRSAGKFDATLADLSARVAAEDASLTEADHRLHLRLVLAQTLPVEAPAAFAAARKRFPDSFALAQLETEHLERTAPLAERVEALRRLAVLRPERSAEWQRRIVGAHRFEGDHDGARRALADLLVLAPADAQNHLLAAEIEFEGGAPEAGVAALQRALRLAADPAPVRLRLARAYSEQGRPASALQLLEESYFSAADDTARRAALAPLVDAAFAAGDLDGLVARFIERNRPRRDTADYYVELGELHLQARDQTSAQENWNRALELRRDDLRLITRLLDLARQNGDDAEVLRLAKLRHEREATPQNAVEFGEALLESEQAAEALELFLTNAAYFYKDTTVLARVLPGLTRENLAQPLIDRLQAEAASAPDLADRDFVLATALAASGDLDAAERLLWQIYQRPVVTPAGAAAPAPDAASSSTPAASASPTTPPPTPQALAYQGLQTASQAYHRLSQLLQQQSGGRFGGVHNTYGGGNALPPNPTGVQDSALGYLGAIALHRDRAAAFVERLEQVLEARGLPASARLHEFAKIQAREPIRRHIDAALDEAAPSPFGLIVARNLLPEPPDRNTGTPVEPSPEIAAKLERLDAALAKLSPQTAGQTRLQRVYQLQQAKKTSEALAAANELLAEDLLPAAERRQLERYLVYLCVEDKRWDEALGRLRTWVEKDPQAQPHPAFHILTRYLQRPETEPATSPDPLPELADLLLTLFARPAANNAPAAMRFGGHRNSLQSEIHDLLYSGAPLTLVPATNQYRHWGQNFAHGVGSDRLPLLLDALAAAAERHADEAARVSGQALVFSLAFQAGDTARAEAVGEALLKIRPDPGLAFNLAELAYREERLDVARRRYEAVPAATGPLAIATQARLLEIALLDETDLEPARAAATRLVRLRPPFYLPNVDLNSTLTDLGLAPAPAARPAGGRAQGFGQRQSRHEEINRLSNELNELVNKKDHDAAERVALRLIRGISPQDLRQGNDWGRRRGLETLVRIGRIDAFIADLEAALARSPGSTLLLEQLAAAHGAIRQASGRAVLAPVASTESIPSLPLRLRLARRGDTIHAAYAALPAPALSAAPESAAPEAAPPPDSPADAAPGWVELGSVSLHTLDGAIPGLVARNQNFRKLADGLFTDARLADQPVAPADLERRDTFQVGERSAAFHAFATPLADGASVEVTLSPRPAGSKARVPADRGLLLRDPADRNARVSLVLDSDDKLVLAARRHTGLRELDYLADLVSRGGADERLRVRYVETLFSADRAEDAVAFVNRPENVDLLPRLANNNALVDHFRKSGRLQAFADLVVDQSLAKNKRPNSYPQLDHEVLQFARRLGRSKDTAIALRIWERLLPSVRDHQAAEVHAEYLQLLLSPGNTTSHDRAVAVLSGFFVPPVTELRPRSPAFDDAIPRFGRQVWYANSGTWNHRFHLYALSVLDPVSDEALLRALLADNAPRLAASTPDWGARCYDVALRLRAFDPSAPDALAALWRDALPAHKQPGSKPPFPLHESPLSSFAPAIVSQLATWPDPDRSIHQLFEAMLAETPPVDARRGRSAGWQNTVFQSNQGVESALRFAWADYHLARGDLARSRAALADLARTFSRQDPRQIAEGSIAQILARLVAQGDLAEARRLADDPLRRLIRRHLGGRRGNQSTLGRILAQLDVLEGKAPSKPALALWTRPAEAADTVELRWEIAGLTEDQNPSTNAYALPPVFGRPRAGEPDGAYDLVVELLANDKAEPAARVELPAVAARGRHALATPLPAGLLRATLRPRVGGDEIKLPVQVFSTRPNLVPNPGFRLEASTAPDRFHRLPDWSSPVVPIPLSGGPAGEGSATRLDLPPRQNGEKIIVSAPIPIDPKSAYVLDGWGSLLPDEHGHVSLEFLDADGEVVGNSNQSQLRSPELRWQRFALVFAASARKEFSRRGNIPEKAVAARIAIGGNLGLGLSELSLRELPPPPPAPPAPPASVSQ